MPDHSPTIDPDCYDESGRLRFPPTPIRCQAPIDITARCGIVMGPVPRVCVDCGAPATRTGAGWEHWCKDCWIAALQEEDYDA